MLIVVAVLNSVTLIVVAWIGLKQEIVRQALVKANGHLEAIVRAASQSNQETRK